MITTNPFAEISASLPPVVAQTYVAVMILLVVGGTLFDVVHKGSARYFFDSWRKTRSRRTQRVGVVRMVSLAVQTAAVEVVTSSEFCNQRRRVAHLLTMYGFLAYVITTAVMVFAYPTPATPAPVILPLLWHLGALMVCAGGYWFWFFMRVDVAAEAKSPFRVMPADLFILLLLASATLGLIWSFSQWISVTWWSSLVFWLYVIATTALFATVPWSKFAHMFFKPAAAFQKRVAEADGTRSNLPGPADKPESLGSARGLPHNY